MSPERFEHLLELVGPKISKKDTRFRNAIPAAERLALTLRFLASGDNQKSLSYAFRIATTTVSRIISETCIAIKEALADKFVKPPRCEEDWLQIAREFERIWNLVNVIGALDGKHIQIESPANSGSLYHNYKGFFSMVLLAICDANYCFTLLDIGQFGSNNDSGVLANSAMGKKFKEKKMRLPKARNVPGCPYEPLPYYLVGDEIFPLKTWLMKPFPGKLTEEQSIYNYRQSRARRVIENTFGILRARWRLFSRPIRATVENVERYVWAAVCLHNYLRLTENASYTPAGFVDSVNSSGDIKEGDWRKICAYDTLGLQNIKKIRGSRQSVSAIEMRNGLKDYVNSEEGSVEWQYRHVRSTGNED